MCSVRIVLDELRRWWREEQRKEGKRMERTERKKKGVMEGKGLMGERQDVWGKGRRMEGDLEVGK